MRLVQGVEETLWQTSRQASGKDPLRFCLDTGCSQSRPCCSRILRCQEGDFHLWVDAHERRSPAQGFHRRLQPRTSAHRTAPTSGTRSPQSYRRSIHRPHASTCEKTAIPRSFPSFRFTISLITRNDHSLTCTRQFAILFTTGAEQRHLRHRKPPSCHP